VSDEVELGLSALGKEDLFGTGDPDLAVLDNKDLLSVH
jgi:hypothetical protein